MKYIVILVINLLFIQTSYSQIHEFGVFIGGSNTIDDSNGQSSILNPSRFAFGGLYKWNRSPRHSWRVSATTNYKMPDLGSENVKTIAEASVGLEFNFFEFNLHQSGFKHTPYIYTGVSVFGFNIADPKLDASETAILLPEDTKIEVGYGIPIILGYKIRINYTFNLGFEVGARYTFTDNIDESNIIVKKASGDVFEDRRYGNLNNNDWYVFTGFTLTYTFGRKPCYCIN
ncbi:conserved hypothetical protein [Formosa agariphila KMM 3901]|uniref:DUF6089 domain-containing protein n=1 Tax=Formosa agariphila (strain DSM 15362 / KCTC 12365 / LMG 23005 / KMM 3901 / M-2Alg 35-1) TaxID=1347342 RepID=T2KHS8_FORAG|nr:DUF6089 family protein [Formosa agariphila]CDF77981.1 conserved hypothetical protein [Formosa agariphila KMM 3901]